jgi:hypothetical protein
VREPPGSGLASGEKAYPPLLKHPHIIHDHPLRKHRGGIRAAGPVAAHGYVEDEEEVVVERVGTAAALGRRELEKLYVIEQPLDAVLFPDERKNVKRLRELGTAG